MTLERKTPLKRTPFNRKVPLNSKRAVRPKSPKRRSEAQELARICERIIEHPSAVCQVDGCGKRPHDPHHRREMGMGGAYANPENVMAVCRPHHDQIHAETDWSRAQGYLVFEGDPGYEELGARLWRIK